MCHKRIIAFVVLLYIMCLSICAQTRLSYITNFTPDEYDYAPQNWGVDISDDGIHYFANSNGLLIKQGENWELVRNAGGSSYRCVNEVENKIYVGGGKNVGYYVRDAAGEYTYTDLSKLLGDFIWGEAWRIIRSDSCIYFQGGKGIFAFDIKTDKLINTIKTKNSHIEIYNGEVYLYGSDGIFKFDHTLSSVTQLYFPVNNSQLFEVRGVFIKKDKHIISTLSDGIFVFQDGLLTPCNKPLNKVLTTNQIYSTLKIKNRYVFGTILDGLYVTDTDLNVLEHLNARNGLKNNTVLSLAKDKWNNVWAGLDYGISYIEIANSIHRNIFNIEIGTAYSSVITSNYNYWGTNQGLFYTTKTNNKAKLVPGTQGQVWALVRIGSSIICLHHKGLFRVDNGQVIKISDEQGFHSMNKIDSSHYLFRCYEHNFLYELDANDGMLKERSAVAGSDLPKDFINMGDKIWFITKNKVSEAEINSSFPKLENKIEYDLQGNARYLYKFNEKIVIEDNNGFYYVNTLNNKIEELPPIKCDETNLQEILFIFIKTKLDNEAIFNTFIGSKELLTPMINIKKRINRTHANSLKSTFIDSTIIFNGVEGFIIYEPNVLNNENNPFVVSLSAAKYREDKEYLFMKNKKIAYANNDVIFNFFTNDNRALSDIQYSYMLHGRDDEFSNFGQNDKKEYTNLREGKYTFEVVAKNNNSISAPITFTFEVVPPYYRSTLARIIYLLVIILTTCCIVQLVKRSYKKKESKILKEKKLSMEMMERNYKIELLNKENIIMTIEKDKLENEVYHKLQELTNSTHNIVVKNNLLLEIKTELESIYNLKDIPLRDKALKKILRNISSSLNNKHDWEIFEEHFSEIHKDFFSKVKELYPEISSTELKLCAYIKLNKSSKEIASLMNISTRGVETARYRLRKKMGISRDDNIHTTLMNI